MAVGAYPDIGGLGFPTRSPAVLSPRCYHTGGGGPVAGTVGTDTPAGTNQTPVATETYMAEIIVMHTCIVQGIAMKNGAVAGTDKLCAALLDGNGNVLAQSAAAGITASGTSAYQALVFGAPIQLRPGVYYVAVQTNGTTTRLAAHTVGKFGAGKATGTTFGTFTGLTPPVTFTTALGPMASLY
jgi:hypothetical protein